VIITTNSSEYLDRAFQRRIDVTIDFRRGNAERWQIGAAFASCKLRLINGC
jgi:hypothetical protein